MAMSEHDAFDGIALAVVKPKHAQDRHWVWHNPSAPPERSTSLGFQSADDAWAWRRKIGDGELLTEPAPEAEWRWHADVIRDTESVLCLVPHLRLDDVMAAFALVGDSSRQQAAAFYTQERDVHRLTEAIRGLSSRSSQTHLGHRWIVAPKVGSRLRRVIQRLVDEHGARIRTARLANPRVLVQD